MARTERAEETRDARTDELGRTPLQVAASNLASDGVRILVGGGAAVNERGVSGVTPLMSAAALGSAASAEALLDLGADLEARDENGQTALIYAARYGHRRVVELLVARGANINAQSAPLLVPAARTTALLAAQLRDYSDIVATLERPELQVRHAFPNVTRLHLSRYIPPRFKGLEAALLAWQEPSHLKAPVIAPSILKRIQVAAESDDVFAQILLGRAHQLGLGIRRDVRAAERWYLQAGGTEAATTLKGVSDSSVRPMGFGNAAGLANVLAPIYIRRLPTTDAWNMPIRYMVSEDHVHYRVISGGPDRTIEPSSLTPISARPPRLQGDDLVLEDGDISSRWLDEIRRRAPSQAAAIVRTAADLRSLATAIEAYATDINAYPNVVFTPPTPGPAPAGNDVERGMALAALGMLYWNSPEGITQNIGAARELFARSSAIGSPLGTLYLAWYYNDLEKNLVAALSFADSAAKAGDRVAQNTVGYIAGRLPEPDHTAAIRAFREAARNGDLLAIYNVANESLRPSPGNGVTQSYSEAVSGLHQAANLGSKYAYSRLADLHFYGIGVKQSLPDALRYYREASDAGEFEASLQYGLLLERGVGTPPSMPEAVARYRRAAARHSTFASADIRLEILGLVRIAPAR